MFDLESEPPEWGVPRPGSARSGAGARGPSQQVPGRQSHEHRPPFRGVVTRRPPASQSLLRAGETDVAS